MDKHSENFREENENPPPEAIRSELERVLVSDGFTRSPRLCEFLRFVVEESLEGRGKRINGTQIAIEVYKRDESFDATTDPVVRTEASRLRRALERYYLTDGKLNSFCIQIPKGGYKPVFQSQTEPGLYTTDSNNTRATGATGTLPEGTASPAPYPNHPVIAVLPFRNLDDSSVDDYFASGFTGQLTTDLTRFDMLRVIAQQSSARYQGQKIDVRKVGQELGARFILEGSVRRNADRIRVEVSFSDAKDGTQLWAGRFDRSLSALDLFSLEDELTQAVIARIVDGYGIIPKAMASASRDKPAKELATYEAMMRYMAYFNQLRAEDFYPAKEALEAAVERESDYGPTLAALSMLCAEEYLRGLNSTPESIERISRLANQAVSLAPSSNIAHLSRAKAAFINRQPDATIAAAERAIEANPNAVSCISFCAHLIGFAGNFDRGIALLSKTHTLNPFHPSWHVSLVCMNHYMRGEYELALDQARLFTLDQWPGTPGYLAAIFGQLGRYAEANAQLNILLEMEPSFKDNPEQYVTRNFLFDDQIEKMMAGLKKAGLK
ncbi:MAG: hypothetical protein KUG72_09630 [Pseudomonadales bacterium]|nr:hypothetical protein [Pseudomonadales bacterium]